MFIKTQRLEYYVSVGSWRQLLRDIATKCFLSGAQFSDIFNEDIIKHHNFINRWLPENALVITGLASSKFHLLPWRIIAYREGRLQYHWVSMTVSEAHVGPFVLADGEAAIQLMKN